MNSSSSSFTPIRPNPFIVGNPVRERSMFYGREEEFALVQKRFHDSDRGAILVFCGERRSGKTSILFQIMDGRLGESFIPVLLDMQSMAVEHEAEFLHRIATEVSLILEDEPLDINDSGFKGSPNPAGVFREYIASELKKHPGKKLVLLVDEYELLENKIESGILSEDVLLVLANLMENHPVYLIFTGSQTLEESSKRYWRVLGASEFRRISYLHPRDAVRLITEPVLGKVEYEEGVVESVCRLTAGQPFYTQAVCQKLVDGLNEQHTNTASQELLDEVASEIVDNPFPQMTFLWDTLEFDERLTLAILAESLESPEDSCSATLLAGRLAERRLPVDTDAPHVASSLESLFQRELLSKDADQGYSFRMDIWRRWIHRMHSPWQVLREEGIDVRKGRRSRLPALLWVLIPLVLITGFFAWREIMPGEVIPLPMPVQAPVSTGRLSIRLSPPQAEIYRGTLRIAGASYDTDLPSGQLLSLTLRAEGYRDSVLAITTHPDSITRQDIALVPLLGAAAIHSAPPGARVSVDGEYRGIAPVEIEGLRTVDPHRVTLELAGHLITRQEFRVLPDTTITLGYGLDQRTSGLTFTSHPLGASILLDDEAAGQTPLNLIGLSLGNHLVHATIEGYVDLDTTVVVTEVSRSIHLELKLLPPGILIVQGDLPARIYIGDQLVKQGYLQNSGPVEVRPGTHSLRVVLTDGSTHVDTVLVSSDEQVTYDYSTQSVTKRTPRSR